MPFEPGDPTVNSLAALCQRVIGDATLWPALPDLETLAALFDAMPPPATYPEALMAAGVLLQFMLAFGDHLHRRLHGGALRVDCRFDPERCIPLPRLDPLHPQKWTAADAVRRWCRRYREAVSTHHDLVVERTRTRLHSDLAQRLRIDHLARQVACSASVLHRRFFIETGESVLQYQTRLRVIEAIPLIRHRDWKADAIARHVGWIQRKDLYRAVKSVTGMNVAGIRRLSAAGLADLLVRLRNPRINRRERPPRQAACASWRS